MYIQMIIELTGASFEDAKQTEELMRCQYGTLNHLSKGQFEKDAKECYGAVLWMRTSEGIAYLQQCENEILT